MYHQKRTHRRRTSRSTANCERIHEDHDLRAAIERGRKQEVILPEPARAVLAEVVLGEDGEEEGHEDAGVDADAQDAQLGGQDGREDLVEAEFWPAPVRTHHWDVRWPSQGGQQAKSTCLPTVFNLT